MSEHKAQPKRRMIFHTPYPLNPEATSASGIRPVQMRRAFESIGYEVYEVTGTSKQRVKAIASLKRQIREGNSFDFVYSESSTMPTAMTEPHHLPLRPRFDLSFLKFCRDHGIPTGLFYRDIYWNQPAYLETVKPIVAVGTRFLYRSDLKRYRSAVSRVYLPSMRMAEEVPHIDRSRCAALPPGTKLVDHGEPESETSMFYVGALGQYYRLHEAVRAFQTVPSGSLTLCTSEPLWRAHEAEYQPLMASANVRVVHANGPALDEHYEAAALGCLFLEPIAYREFAAPMKMYEYLGHGKPIIAVEGSLAAAFVESNGIGWVLPYRAEALSELLNRIHEDPTLYTAMRERVLVKREEHTWAARARQVAEELTAL